MLEENSNNRPQLEPMLPLINIVFLLLIFFLIAGNPQAPLLPNIVPPNMADELDSIAEASSDWVYLSNDGEFIYRDNVLNDFQIEAQFSQAPLILFADADTSGAELAEVLQRLSRLNIQQFSIVSERGDDA